MLRRLSSSLATFKTLAFHENLNILVADRTQASTETDTRNGAGKSSVIELCTSFWEGVPKEHHFLSSLNWWNTSSA